MFNSVIIDKTIKLYKLFACYYKNSIFNKLFYIVDSFFKNAILNSITTKIIISPNNTSILRNSYAYKLTSNVLTNIRKVYSIVRRYIFSSYLTNICANIIDSVSKNPLRIIAIFGIAFIISNIVCSIFTKATNIQLVVIQIILALILLPLIKSNITLKKLLRESSFYNLFRWIISL